MASSSQEAKVMAKITLIIEDDGDGNATVEFIPDPDFDGDSEDLTPAQHLSMKVMNVIVDDEESENIVTVQ